MPGTDRLGLITCIARKATFLLAMAIHSAQALPLVFAVLTLIGSLSLTIVHGIARGKARELEEWNWGDKLIRETPLPRRLCEC